MCSGRPVLVLGGHFGNWEVGSVAFGAFGFPVNAVARDLDRHIPEVVDARTLHADSRSRRVPPGHRRPAPSDGRSIAKNASSGTLALLRFVRRAGRLAFPISPSWARYSHAGVTSLMSQLREK